MYFRRTPSLDPSGHGGAALDFQRTAVLIETLVTLGAGARWVSCNIGHFDNEIQGAC